MNEDILNPFNSILKELTDNIETSSKLNDDGSITMRLSFDAKHIRNLIKELYIGCILKNNLSQDEVYRYAHLIATLTEPKL